MWRAYQENNLISGILWKLTLTGLPERFLPLHSVARLWSKQQMTKHFTTTEAAAHELSNENILGLMLRKKKLSFLCSFLFSISTAHPSARLKRVTSASQSSMRKRITKVTLAVKMLNEMPRDAHMLNACLRSAQTSVVGWSPVRLGMGVSNAVDFVLWLLGKWWGCCWCTEFYGFERGQDAQVLVKHKSKILAT